MSFLQEFEAPRPGGGASRARSGEQNASKGNFILVVPLDPAYLTLAGGALAGHKDVKYKLLIHLPFRRKGGLRMKDLEERIRQLAHLMFESKYLVVFTGAGISTESGLPDFRGPDGIWTRQGKGPEVSFTL